MSPKNEETRKDPQSEQGMTNTAKDEEVKAVQETEVKRLSLRSEEKTTERNQHSVCTLLQLFLVFQSVIWIYFAI